MNQRLTRASSAAGAAVAVATLVGCQAAPGNGPSAGQEVPLPSVSSAGEPATPSPTPTSFVDGTYMGDASQNPRGTVQVEIVVTNQRISDIHIVQCPSDAQRSKQICTNDVPVLVSRSLSAQSADIDAVSGATFTSNSYKQSLQSAIDQAGQ